MVQVSKNINRYVSNGAKEHILRRALDAEIRGKRRRGRPTVGGET